MAVALPPGYRHDLVLLAVSHHLRWFGQPDAGAVADLAISNQGSAYRRRDATPGDTMSLVLTSEYRGLNQTIWKLHTLSDLFGRQKPTTVLQPPQCAGNVYCCLIRTHCVQSLNFGASSR